MKGQIAVLYVAELLRSRTDPRRGLSRCGKGLVKISHRRNAFAVLTYYGRGLRASFFWPLIMLSYKFMLNRYSIYPCMSRSRVSRGSQQRTTLGLSIPLVALRVSTTNWDSPTTRR